MDKEIKELNEHAQKHARTLATVKAEIGKVIVGQDKIIERMLIALVADGHVLIEGVPGLAKTLLVKTVSDCLDCNFVRLQFTPDILPADITGTKIYNAKESSFKTVKGPIFSNFVLADEINRAPPKVQSALLEAMQEEQVSIQGETYPLDKPFFVLATQNPIESEGTYKLPEAQVDRFMFKLIMNYPLREEEKEIIRRFTKGHNPSAKKIISKAGILEIQKFCKSVYADEKIEDYVSKIVDATRNYKEYRLDFESMIDCGASPRASIWLILGAKAHALMQGRGYVLPEDVKEVAHEVLRHRIIISYEAEAEGKTPDEFIEKILATVKVP